MVSTNMLSRQPTELDYADSTKFRFKINKLPKVEFFTTQCTLPGINLGDVVIPSPFKEIKSSRDSEHSNTFLKLVFISRITPIKNLLFLLSILRNCSNKIQFDIYGPISDINYWKKCTDLISKMPPNIKVSYLKEIHADLVSETFSKYHLFALPTLGENFGHVIIESLFAGTPVVLSDKTPWESSNDLSLRIIPLKARNIWTEYIDSFLCNFKNNSTRKDAIIFGKKLISKQKIYEKNVTLFDFVCLK